MDLERKSVTILLVEDDPGHARLIEKNLRRSNITNEIINITDGQEAVDFLLGSDGDAKTLSPLLILLDLNIPGLDGYQVLKRIKADSRTSKIPVVILTSADDIREIKRCYELGCNIYVTKPVDYDQFADAIRKLGLFLSIVQMPGEE